MHTDSQLMDESSRLNPMGFDFSIGDADRWHSDTKPILFSGRISCWKPLFKCCVNAVLIDGGKRRKKGWSLVAYFEKSTGVVGLIHIRMNRTQPITQHFKLSKGNLI